MDSIITKKKLQQSQGSFGTRPVIPSKPLTATLSHLAARPATVVHEHVRRAPKMCETKSRKTADEPFRQLEKNAGVHQRSLSNWNLDISCQERSGSIAPPFSIAICITTISEDQQRHELQTDIHSC